MNLVCLLFKIMAGTRFVEESDEDLNAFFLTSKKNDLSRAIRPILFLQDVYLSS